MPDLHDLLPLHGDAIARAVASYAPPGPTRDDLTQEVLVALLTSLPRLRDPAALKAFALRVVHRVCLRAVLEARRSPPLDDLEPARPVGPWDALVEADARARLQVAVRALPLGLRQPLVLALEELDHKEIGAILGLSEGAVAVRLHRARARLRELLGGADV